MAKLSIEDKKEIIRLRLEEGLSIVEVARKFNIVNSTVYSLVSKYKIHGDKIFDITPRSFSPEIKLKIINRAFNNESKSSLGIEYNIECSLINVWISHYKSEGYNGLIDKPKGRPPAMKNRKIDEEKQEELDKLNDRQKDERILELEAEVAVLKKLRALVLARNTQQTKKK